MSPVLPPATILQSSGFVLTDDEEDDLHGVHARQYYHEEDGVMVVKTLLEVRDSLSGASASSAPAPRPAHTGRDSDTETLNYIHSLVVKALENPSSRLIVDAAISALGEVDHHSSLWARLDELLVHTGRGHGARSTESFLCQLRGSTNHAPEAHHIKLEVYSAPQTRTHWVISPKDIPADGQSPPLVLDLQGHHIPEYCVYIQPGEGAVRKAWLMIPGRGWKEVSQGDRHPLHQDRILRLARNDGQLRPSWPKETSMGAMRRRDRAKATSALDNH